MKKRLPQKIQGCKPCGSCILIEQLEDGDLMDGKVIIPDTKTPLNLPQGYILALGPEVPKNYGFKVGDRVLLQGTSNPVPDFDLGRPLALVEPHTVRAILEEETVFSDD
jgi:co-chaperonin GroES (HSP10)